MTAQLGLFEADVDPQARSLREIARRVVGPHELLAAHRGGMEAARQQIAGHHQGAYGGGQMFQVDGRHVRYDWDGITGKVSVTELLRIALDAAAPTGAERLDAALRERGAAYQAEHEYGPYWTLTAEQRQGPEWLAIMARERDADREMYAAQAAWWTS